MENFLALFVGMVVFLIMILFSKLFNIMPYKQNIDGSKEKVKKHIEIFIRIIGFFMALIVYYLICLKAGIHHKLCCSLKAWAITLAINAVYNQLYAVEDCE